MDMYIVVEINKIPNAVANERWLVVDKKGIPFAKRLIDKILLVIIS